MEEVLRPFTCVRWQYYSLETLCYKSCTFKMLLQKYAIIRKNILKVQRVKVLVFRITYIILYYWITHINHFNVAVLFKFPISTLLTPAV